MQRDQSHEPFWKRHLDKIDVGGSLFAALCCLGFPALLAILSAIGLGFLVNDAVLIPRLVLFLVVTLWVFTSASAIIVVGRRSSSAWRVPALTIASIWFGNGLLAGVGIVGLVAGSLLNVWLRMQ